MKVLVTGGTGYLGRAIVRALAARGHTPVVFARSASSAGLPGRAIDGDVRDPRALMDAARGVDAICHTAGLVAVWRADARAFDAVNVGGLLNVLEAAHEHRLARVVYTSSFLALPPAGRTEALSANDYQRTKAAAYRVARQAAGEGAPIVILIPGVMFGPGVMSEGNLVGRLLADHLAGRLPGIIGADRLWSFAWVDAVADAHVTALESGQPGAEFALGGENLPQRRPFELLRDAHGTPLPRSIPPWAGVIAGAGELALAKLTGRSPRLTPATVEIFRHDWPLDSARAAADLRYRPLSLAEGIGRVLRELIL